MAYLAAVDVTVTLAPQDIDFLGVGKRVSFPSVAFGNGALQYTALGIPMPAIGYFGMKKVIDRVFIEQPANGFIYSFDRANHKLRIYLGAARGAITMDAVTAGTPAGNLSNLAAGAFTGDSKTPTGNLANLAAGAFTGDAATPTGNVANSANHSHDLLVVGNGIAPPVGMVGVNGVNLCANVGANATILGADAAAKGGVLDKQVGAGAFTGDSKTPTGNVANGTGVFVGTAATPTGNVANGTGVFTGAALGTHTHAITGGGAVAEAALAEMDDGVAPAATTLYMQVIGQ